MIQPLLLRPCILVCIFGLALSACKSPGEESDASELALAGAPESPNSVHSGDVCKAQATAGGVTIVCGNTTAFIPNGSNGSQGPSGPQGTQGPQGPQGIPGAGLGPVYILKDGNGDQIGTHIFGGFNDGRIVVWDDTAGGFLQYAHQTGGPTY
jgi:hypothetical protein